jgi:hypothetical protein
MGAVIVLIIGWVVGRLLGSGLSKVIDKLGVDDTLGRTMVGKALEKSGMTCVRFFDLFIGWFIYLIAILAAVDILEITVLRFYINAAVQYLPSFIAGFFILIVGIITADFMGDAIEAICREMKVEFTFLLTNLLKLMLYSIVVIIALTTMRIDISIIYLFTEPLAWGITIGVSIGLGIAFGWGLKDTVARNADRWIGSAKDMARRAEDFWNWYTHKKETENEG